MGLILIAYGGLLAAVYLFVSTREATIAQLILTVALAVAAPALFFVLQATSVRYTDELRPTDLVKDCLRLVVVSVPVIAITGFVPNTDNRIALLAARRGCTAARDPALDCGERSRPARAAE
jgi:hypothetical protein